MVIVNDNDDKLRVLHIGGFDSTRMDEITLAPGAKVAIGISRGEFVNFQFVHVDEPREIRDCEAAIAYHTEKLAKLKKGAR